MGVGGRKEEDFSALKFLWREGSSCPQVWWTWEPCHLGGGDFEFKVLSRHQAGPKMWTGCAESGAKIAVIFYQSFDFYFNKEIIVSLAEVFCVSSF